MRKFVLSFIILVSLLLFSTSAMAAFFINFENGIDGNPVDNITGISFESFNGYTSLYADSRTGAYNTTSDDLAYGSGSYHHNGNFCLWAGPDANAQGVKVDFTNNDGTFFRTGYSAYSDFYLEAFFTDGTSSTVIGAANTNNPMGYLQINAPNGLFLDYVVLHDTGNFWCVDDMSGDSTGIPSTPIPSAALLLGPGLLSLLGIRKRMNR